MDKRIRFILHQKKQILLVDFSACSPLEVEAIGRAIPEYVSVQPRASVLLLADFTGASFSSEALRVLKERVRYLTNLTSRSLRGWVRKPFRRHSCKT